MEPPAIGAGKAVPLPATTVNEFAIPVRLDARVVLAGEYVNSRMALKGARIWPVTFSVRVAGL
jgi:hypothetical protein